MFAPILKAFTSPAAGPAASLVALALAAALGLTWAQQTRERSALEARLADASHQSQVAGVYWKARYAACEASVGGLGPRDGGVTKVAEGGTGGDPMTRLSHEPAGFDVCARMEAADQAVLASLK